MVDLGKEAPLILHKKKLQKEEKLAGQPTPPTSPSLAPPLGMYVLYLYCIVFVFCASGGIVYYYTIVLS